MRSVGGHVWGLSVCLSPWTSLHIVWPLFTLSPLAAWRASSRTHEECRRRRARCGSRMDRAVHVLWLTNVRIWIVLMLQAAAAPCAPADVSIVQDNIFTDISVYQLLVFAFFDS